MNITINYIGSRCLLKTARMNYSYFTIVNSSITIVISIFSLILLIIVTKLLVHNSIIKYETCRSQYTTINL